jgi:outer membrane autotransporter protein
MTRFASICAALAVCGPTAFAYTNILENGTNVLVDSDWDLTGQNLVVGGTTSYNLLQISKGGRVTNSNTFIGNAAGSDSNRVLVAGPDAGWTMSGDLYTGATGSVNYLEISAGAVVSNANSFVGAASGAEDNWVVVIGADTRWDNAGLISIGSGSSNLVAVSDGGTVSAGGLAVAAGGTGFLLNDGGTFRANGAFDAGLDGFHWNAGGTLVAASNLTGITVSNGWNVLDGDRNLVIDGGTWSTETSNLLVDSANLSTTNGGWVFVGEATTNLAAGGILVASTNGAQLRVENGATIGTDDLYIGSGAASGTVSVANGGVVAVENLAIDGSGAFNLDRGGRLAMTGDFDYDAQTNLNWNAGGALYVEGNLTKSNGLAGTERTLRIDGGSWTTVADLVVSGTSNNLQIANGGGVTNDSAQVGTGPSDADNTVWVWGKGTAWKIGGELAVGAINNTGNNVNVGEGGRIEIDTLAVATNNSFNLETGGTLAFTGDFDLGDHAFLNWNAGGNLSVGGDLAGMVTVSDAIIGETAVLNGGRILTLDGPAAQWTNGTRNLVVGYNGAGSGLVITNGATVSNANGYIGWGTGSFNNSVQVSGANSLWANTGGGFYVGMYGSPTNLSYAPGNNNLSVEDGAWVFVGEATTNAPGGGMLVASTNGAELVVGNGRVDIDGTLFLGLDAGTAGTNLIRNGGTVSAGTLAIASGSYLDLMEGGTFSVGSAFDVAGWSTNGFNWGEGATLSVGGALSGMATTNLVRNGTTNGYAYLEGGRSLALDGAGASWNPATNLAVGVGAGGSKLEVLNGAQLDTLETVLGWETDDNEIKIDGGSIWNNGGDLTIGYNGSGNQLSVSGGGTNNVAGSLFVGAAGTSNNLAFVGGSNSLLNVDQNLQVGAAAAKGNVLQVEGPARVDVGGDLFLYSSNAIVFNAGGTVGVGSNMTVQGGSGLFGTGTNLLRNGNSTLFFNGDGIVIDQGIVFRAEGGGNTVAVNDGTFGVAGTVSNQYVNFQTLELTDSDLTGYGALEASTFGTVEMAGGTISPEAEDGSSTAKLTIGGDLVLNGGTRYLAQFAMQDEMVVHDLLVVEGASGVDLSKLDLVVLVPISAIDTNIPILIATNGGFAGSFNSTNIADRMLLFDSKLLVENDIASIRTEANGKKFSSALAYAGSEGVRAGYGAMKNSVAVRTKQLRRNLVSTAHSISQEAYLMSNTNAPAGAEGPGDQNTVFDMHVWMQFFSGQGSYDAQGNSYGFDLDNGGTSIGFDRLVGENLDVGFNYTYARSNARTTNDDWLETENYWLGAYGEWIGEEGLYVDTLAAMGFSNYDSQRQEANYLGTAAYRGTALGASADVGQYYYYKNFALSPFVGLHALRIVSEGHTETEAEGGGEIYVDKFAREWLESALGLKARYRVDSRIGRFQVTGFAEWTHDFINGDVYSSLSANGLPAVDMARISPDADVVNAGLGLSWMCTDYLEIGAGYNGRFSDRYEEHAGSLLLDIRF